jgi:hypothetical protein
VVAQTVHHRGSWDWDCTVALEYAAEQLSKVSQPQTCGAVPSTELLSSSYLKCISSVLQHESLLPTDVAIGLRDARQEYLRMPPPNVSKARCDCLASRLLTILRDVTNLLAVTKLRIAA